MKKINSKQKGKRGELELANYLKKHGLLARRGQQFKGTPESPDVICDNWNDIHIEVKRVEKLNVDKALDKSTEDAGDLIPVVIHRKNNTNWKVTMWLDDFINLYKQNEK